MGGILRPYNEFQFLYLRGKDIENEGSGDFCRHEIKDRGQLRTQTSCVAHTLPFRIAPWTTSFDDLLLRSSHGNLYIQASREDSISKEFIPNENK